MLLRRQRNFILSDEELTKRPLFFHIINFLDKTTRTTRAARNMWKRLATKYIVLQILVWMFLFPINPKRQMNVE